MTTTLTSSRFALLAGLAGLALSHPAAASAQTPQAAAPGPDRPAADTPSAAFAYDRFVLPNGLTVLVHTNRAVPVVHVGVRYRIGSRDEPEGKSGFAHLFEHLMFQATAHRAGEFFTPLTRAGASGMNGATDLDHTDYYETVPTGALDLALWLESDRMGYLDGGITQSLLDGQRAVVKSEKRQGDLQPETAVQAWFQQHFYPPGHPYAHTTIGSMADIDGATLADVKGWFRDKYGAGNAVLVLVGDIDVATAREKVARYFGAIRRGEPVSRPIAWSPTLEAIRRDEIHDRFDAPAITRTWSVANADPRERTMLLLLARALGAPDAALHRTLVDGGIANAVGASFTTYALTDLFSVSITPKPGVTPDRAGQALDKAITDFLAAGPDPVRLQIVARATDMYLLRALEDNGQLASLMLAGEEEADDPGLFMKQRHWAAAATPADLTGVAARWLTRPYYEMRLVPTPAAAPALPDVDRTAMPAVTPPVARVAFPRVTRLTLANGMTVVVAERPGAPIIDAALRLEVGADDDDPARPGVAQAAVSLLTAGTQSRDEAALARQIALGGFGLSASVGDEDGMVRWAATPDRLAEAMALAADIVRRPRYAEARVARTAAALADARDAMLRDPIQAGEGAFRKAFWNRPDPAATTRAPSRADLVAFHSAHIRPGAATLYLVGDVTPAAARALAEQAFGDWQAGPPRAPAPVPAPADTARIVLIDAPGSEQSSIIVGAPVPPFDADRAAAEALVDTTLAGGFESRINLALRNKGWSYGLTGNIEDRAGPRGFTASGTVERAHTAEAMAEIRRQIAAFVGSDPITERELDAARSAAMHRIPLRLAGNGGIQASIIQSSRLGLPYDRGADATVRIAGTSLADVRRAAAALYRPDRLTWVVVGDLAVIEPAIRAMAMAPVEVWDTAGTRLR